MGYSKSDVGGALRRGKWERGTEDVENWAGGPKKIDSSENVVSLESIDDFTRVNYFAPPR